LPAAAGWASINEDDTATTLVEFPYGAHGALLLALDDTSPSTRVRIIGAATNSTDAPFHVRETSDRAGHEVVTLDHIMPLGPLCREV
jgi:hypothetical protein